MKAPRRAQVIVAALAALFLGLVAFRAYVRFRPKPVVLEPPAAVSVVRAGKKDLKRYVKVLGSVQPATASNLALKTAGRVARVPVSLGQAVDKDDALVILDSSDLASQLKAAEAAYELATANLARVELTAPVLEQAQAESAMKQAQAQAGLAARNLERMSYLAQQGAIPIAQAESAQTQFEVATAQLEAASKNLGVVLSGTSRQAVAAARAQRKQAEASFELALSQLTAATLVAPFDGIISYVNINPGEIAAPGMPVVGIVEKGSLLAEFAVSEKQVKALRDGQVISVNVPSVGKMVEAKVTGISPSSDPRSRLFKVRVAISKAGPEFKPGMMAEATVLEDSKAGCLTIPQECVVGGSVDPGVFVVVDGKAQRRPVRLGISDGRDTEVLSGVEEGDLVVKRGQTFLKEGKAVKVLDGGDR